MLINVVAASMPRILVEGKLRDLYSFEEASMCNGSALGVYARPIVYTEEIELEAKTLEATAVPIMVYIAERRGDRGQEATTLSG